MRNVQINGNSIKVSGNNITVINDKVFVDGQEVELGNTKHTLFNIVVEGNTQEISGNFEKIVIKGDAGTVTSTNGDINVRGNVTQDVSTNNGDVTIKGHVHGNVKTLNGNIKHR